MRVFLLGHRIAYSQSPEMQNAAFRAVGLDWTYQLLDVPESGLSEAVHMLRTEDVAGANVTIPYKRAVMAMLDKLDPLALEAGAVNTIKTAHGALWGSNTDIAAIGQAVRELGINPRGAAAVILGTGGSARSAAAALNGARVTFVSRHPEVTPVPMQVVGWQDASLVDRIHSADVLVNATPLGREGEMPTPDGALPESGAVIDLVYVQGGTPLVAKARARGLRAADGWGILLAQGALSFEVWTATPAPLGAMRETLHP